MDRKTFVRQLEALLADWPDPQEREEQILYYEEMLVDLTDEQASQRIQQLGGPRQVAEELRRQKGLPPLPQAGSWQQQTGWGDDSGSQPPLEQRLAETKLKNRRKARRMLAAIAAGVVVLAAVAAGAIWMLSRQGQPAESGTGSGSSLPASSLVPASSGDSGALSGSAASGSSPASGSSGDSDSAFSSPELVLPVSGQLPEGASQATRLTVDAAGADLTVKSGDAWNLATSENAEVQAGLNGDTLELELGAGAFVLTVPAGVTDLELTASQGRLDLRQLEADTVVLDSTTAETALAEVTARSLSITLQMGGLQATGLALGEELHLDLRSGSAQITMEQPASYGYTVECLQGSLALGPDSWTSQGQPQQASQTGEGFQFDLKVTQGSGSVQFAAP